MKKIIGLRGGAGSGKNTVAELIRLELTNVAELAFADPFKEFLYYVFDTPRELLWGSSANRKCVLVELGQEHTWKEIEERIKLPFTKSWAIRILGTSRPDKIDVLIKALDTWVVATKAEALANNGVTLRYLLQTFGTECGRSVDINIWRDYGLRQAKNFLRAPHIRASVLTDCRMINEVQGVRDEGGEVLFVDRPEAGLTGAAAKHQSETELKSDEIRKLDTGKIENYGTLDDLHENVRKEINRIFKR